MRNTLDPSSIVREHEDRRVHLFNVNGQSLFPILGASGGILACAMVYFYAGFLDEGRDLGRGGPLQHAHGYSWAVQLKWTAEDAPKTLRLELQKFSEYLDEKSFR